MINTTLPARFIRLCSSAALFITLGVASLKASADTPAESVNRLIEMGSYGRKPFVWFRTSANQNTGSGNPTLVATSGGRLNERGPDPWGNPDSAFGPAAADKSGVAITGSGTSSVMPAREGTVLFFYRAPAGLALPAILVNRGDFNQPGCLGLRICKTNTGPALTLLRQGVAASETRQIWIAPFNPEEWTFVAAAWTEKDNLVKLRYWSGTLRGRELTEGEDSYALIPTEVPMNKVVLIGGRKREQQGLATLAFSGGLFHQMAFYDYALSDETVKDIYLAACRR
jgi:hypothetical protein